MTATGKPVIGVIGGTGHLGGALAGRWCQAGYRVVIGSRDAERARAAAAAHAPANGGAVSGASNREAAREATVVVVAVPFASQEATLAEIRDEVAGKLVVDTTVPLVPPKVMRVQLPPEGSAAVRAQALLGEAATVVSAFHNVAAHRLATGEPVDCDVLVFGEKREARERVVELAHAVGLRGLHAGSLANSAAAEALTSILIFINKHYSADGAGLRITGDLKSGAG
ncbi:MAG: NADPH-dependent F420 reductase [Steroidobacteraceae bacterium]|nr:NADPH-dependent F420 reductase [Steroidobacteraceae bacterium]